MGILPVMDEVINERPGSSFAHVQGFLDVALRSSRCDFGPLFLRAFRNAESRGGGAEISIVDEIEENVNGLEILVRSLMLLNRLGAGPGTGRSWDRGNSAGFRRR